MAATRISCLTFIERQIYTHLIHERQTPDARSNPPPDHIVQAGRSQQTWVRGELRSCRSAGHVVSAFDVVGADGTICVKPSGPMQKPPAAGTRLLEKLPTALLLLLTPDAEEDDDGDDAEDEEHGHHE